MRKLLKNRKGASPVIAVLLMIAIAVAAAILVYVWSMGLIGGLQAGGGEQTKEQIIMEAYAWQEGSGLTLHLRNVGQTDISIAAIYIEGDQVASDVATLDIQEYSMVSVPNPGTVTLVPGTSYTIKVTTQTGAIFTFSAVYGTAA